MRTALAAALLILLSTPAFAECRYINKMGQSIIWDGKSPAFKLDPAFSDVLSCTLTRIPDTDGYNATCGQWRYVFMPVSSTIGSDKYDIAILDLVAFWLKCSNGA